MMRAVRLVPWSLSGDNESQPTRMVVASLQCILVHDQSLEQLRLAYAARALH